jgi:hypothetical protein
MQKQKSIETPKVANILRIRVMEKGFPSHALLAQPSQRPYKNHRQKEKLPEEIQFRVIIDLPSPVSLHDQLLNNHPGTKILPHCSPTRKHTSNEIQIKDERKSNSHTIQSALSNPKRLSVTLSRRGKAWPPKYWNSKVQRPCCSGSWVVSMQRLA